MMEYILKAVKSSLALILPLVLVTSVYAKIQEHTLTIAKEKVNITGQALERITVNGNIPGPTLRFTEGDTAVIRVINTLDEYTSVHWHGLLLPGEMDGVPDFNGFAGIRPNTTFVYRFDLRQSGTYWYHAHSKGQEQDGHYGSIVVHPKRQDLITAERDYVILFSDFHTDDSKTIMANLKKDSEYYVYTRRTVGDFFTDVRKMGFGTAWENAQMWNQMRMMPTDLADIGDYTFLVNGKTPEQNWTGLFTLSERIRLRFINASAMSFFDVRIPNLKMTVVSADGQPVEPVDVDEFRFGVAETYDVIIQPQENRAYTIVAEPLDRSGFALATLAPQVGMRGEMPKSRARSLLTMADMGMSHLSGDTSHSNHNAHSHHSNHHVHSKSMATSHSGHYTKENAPPAEDFDTGVAGSGWADADTPQGHKALSYKDLRYLGTQRDVRKPQREIIVRLGGNMDRYTWTINGQKYQNSSAIKLKYGERVRLVFINDTMMAHPMHLHGMFVQLENGQSLAKLPNKHTVVVAPGDRYSALLTADEAGEWAFHCHLLYHMMSGMMSKVVVAELNEGEVPSTSQPTKASNTSSHPKSHQYAH